MTTAVLDIGSTNIKIAIVGTNGALRRSASRPTPHRTAPPYRHIDVDEAWGWLLATLAELADGERVEAVITSAHGSSAALLEADGRLAMPFMYYEAEPPEFVKRSYATIAPPFGEVFAPTNPASLTLARQLHWIETVWPDAFGRVTTILPYAQFWTRRLCGTACSEVTALGAQTHLWAPLERGFSSLARARGWDRLFPPLRPAWETVGGLLPEVARATGLTAGTPVLCGVHDSNANYARYLAMGLDDFTLMSTGTWLITFNATGRLETLDPTRDAVSNSDVTGRPVACSRFMAGREWAALAGDAASTTDGEEAEEEAALRRLIERGTMALPAFTDSGGPFPEAGGQGRIIGAAPATPAESRALATLYAALMSSAALDVVGADNRLVIDGPFALNPLFCGLMAALRPDQRVEVSRMRDGTVLGAAALRHWPDRGGEDAALAPAEPVASAGLAAYATAWAEATAAIGTR